MDKLFYIIILASFCARTTGLICYACEDCPLPDTKDLKVCVSTTTTSAPSTSESSTISDTTSTPESSTSGAPESSSEPMYVTKRKRRFVQDESISNKGCLCYSGKCDCTGKYMAMRADGTTFQCYKHIHIVGGYKVVDRGCKELSDGSNETACSLINAAPEDCTVCKKDKCNSALSFRISIAILIFALTMPLL